MIVVYTSDLHGNTELYSALFELAEERRARAVIIGGDMLAVGDPFQCSLREQKDFIFSYLKPKLKNFLSKVPQATIYAMLGNYDWSVSNIHLKSLEEKGMLRLLHGQKHALRDDYELIGYAHVPPTPFTASRIIRLRCQQGYRPSLGLRVVIKLCQRCNGR
jgi:Icc-related predicted phosphoesterase